MVARLRRPAALEWQVFRGTEAVREGLVTRGGLRSPSWQRLRHDVYADSRLDRDHSLACFAAALTLPPDAVIAGRSAALVRGRPRRRLRGPGARHRASDLRFRSPHGTG